MNQNQDQGVVLMVVSASTPAQLYYQSQASAAYGGNISVTARTFQVSHQAAVAWLVDGVAAPDLLLYRGIQYRFQVQILNSATHDLAIKRIKQQPGDLYQFFPGVSGSGTGTLVFDVPHQTPDTLYYQCKVHDNMFGRIRVRTLPRVIKAARAADFADWIIDGNRDPVLHVARGATYHFAVEINHQFYIKTQGAVAGSVASYGPGVFNNGATQNGAIVSLVVRHDAPTTLFYQCGVHAVMWGTIHVHEDVLQVTKDTGDAYLMGGLPNHFVRLTRGLRYAFAVDAPGRPLHLKTARVLGTDSDIDGVVGNGVDQGTVVWSVPEDAPETVFYQSASVSDMGGKVYVENSCPEPVNVTTHMVNWCRSCSLPALSINPGDTVRWRIDDDLPHTVSDGTCTIGEDYSDSCTPKMFNFLNLNTEVGKMFTILGLLPFSFSPSSSPSVFSACF